MVEPDPLIVQTFIQEYSQWVIEMTRERKTDQEYSHLVSPTNPIRSRPLQRSLGCICQATGPPGQSGYFLLPRFK
jgi:hypothetical protein